MVFGLTIGTERAAALQVSWLFFEMMDMFLLSLVKQSIQDELTKRGYSPDAGAFVISLKAFLWLSFLVDPVMAEYITIMVINNKTAGKLTFQLERGDRT